MTSLGILLIVAVAITTFVVLFAVPVVLLGKSRATAQGACPSCQGKFAGAARFCPHCGQTLA